jgi:hypothetical protein
MQVTGFLGDSAALIAVRWAKLLAPPRMVFGTHKSQGTKLEISYFCC